MKPMNNQEFLDHLASFASRSFMDSGSLMAMFVLMDNEGQHYVYLTPFSNEQEKDMTSNFIKSQVKKNNAVRIGFMSETWMARPPKGTTHEQAMKMIPSEHPDRMEAILITVENIGGMGISGVMKINRDQDGNPSLDKLEMNEWSGTEGRFANFFERQTAVQ